MASLDSTINTLIPIILILVTVGWIWYKFGEPLKRLFGWVGSKVSGGANSVRSKATQYNPGEIVYR